MQISLEMRWEMHEWLKLCIWRQAHCISWALADARLDTDKQDAVGVVNRCGLDDNGEKKKKDLCVESVL